MRQFLLSILLLFTYSISNAAQFNVTNITKDTGMIFTPGNSFFLGKCSYNWGGDKAYRVKEFFEGISSYSLTTYKVGNNVKCFNIKTDIADKITIPYINPSRSTNSITTGNVAFASSAMIGTFFTVKESSIDFNETYIYAGVRGTPNYFYCQLPTDSLTLQWVLSTGIEKEFAPGWKFTMTWFGGERKCAGIRMTFDPELLEPVVNENPLPNCPYKCKP